MTASSHPSAHDPRLRLPACPFRVSDARRTSPCRCASACAMRAFRLRLKDCNRIAGLSRDEMAALEPATGGMVRLPAASVVRMDKLMHMLQVAHLDRAARSHTLIHTLRGVKTLHTRACNGAWVPGALSFCVAWRAAWGGSLAR